VIEVTSEINNKQKKILEQIQGVFNNPISLGLSFRINQHITKEFLVSTPDIDFDSIDQLIKLCEKNASFHEEILTYLVQYTPNP